jgi:hypothetical protein
MTEGNGPIIEYELVDADGNSIGSRVTTRDGLDHRALMDHVGRPWGEKRGNPNEILTCGGRLTTRGRRP